MKKKKIYVNKITKEINNNQKYCDVIETNEEIKEDGLSIDEKLDKIFNTNGYVFSKDVKIITNDNSYKTKIAGKVNNYLITMDNDVIDISSIKDIVY